MKKYILPLLLFLMIPFTNTIASSQEVPKQWNEFDAREQEALTYFMTQFDQFYADPTSMTFQNNKQEDITKEVLTYQNDYQQDKLNTTIKLTQQISFIVPTPTIQEETAKSRNINKETFQYQEKTWKNITLNYQQDDTISFDIRASLKKDLEKNVFLDSSYFKVINIDQKEALNVSIQDENTYIHASGDKITYHVTFHIVNKQSIQPIIKEYTITKDVNNYE